MDPFLDRVDHKTISTNGILMDVASMGTKGPAILFLHGFPELWYSWRHQLLFFSDLGFQAIAPDLRGYSASASPPTFHSYTFFHHVGDLIGLLDYFSIDRVFLVGHDWGAAIAWAFALFRPDRVKALVALSVPFSPRLDMDVLSSLRAAFGDDYYVCRFQEPNDMEEEFDSMDKRNLFKILFSIHNPEPLKLPKGKGIKEFPVPDTLPSWLSEEDITYYASKYEDIGFRGGLNYFRAIKLNWELTAPWTEAKVEVPAKFIVGEEDFVYHIPDLKPYVHRGGFQRDVPQLKDVEVIKGAAHYVQQESPEEVNKHILKFITEF